MSNFKLLVIGFIKNEEKWHGAVTNVWNYLSSTRHHDRIQILKTNSEVLLHFKLSKEELQILELHKLHYTPFHLKLNFNFTAFYQSCTHLSTLAEYPIFPTDAVQDFDLFLPNLYPIYKTFEDLLNHSISQLSSAFPCQVFTIENCLTRAHIILNHYNHVGSQCGYSLCELLQLNEQQQDSTSNNTVVGDEDFGYYIFQKIKLSDYKAFLHLLKTLIKSSQLELEMNEKEWIVKPKQPFNQQLKFLTFDMYHSEISPVVIRTCSEVKQQADASHINKAVISILIEFMRFFPSCVRLIIGSKLIEFEKNSIKVLTFEKNESKSASMASILVHMNACMYGFVTCEYEQIKSALELIMDEFKQVQENAAQREDEEPVQSAQEEVLVDLHQLLEHFLTCSSDDSNSNIKDLRLVASQFVQACKPHKQYSYKSDRVLKIDNSLLLQVYQDTKSIDKIVLGECLKQLVQANTFHKLEQVLKVLYHIVTLAADNASLVSLKELCWELALQATFNSIFSLKYTLCNTSLKTFSFKASEHTLVITLQLLYLSLNSSSHSHQVLIIDTLESQTETSLLLSLLKLFDALKNERMFAMLQGASHTCILELLDVGLKLFSLTLKIVLELRSESIVESTAKQWSHVIGTIASFKSVQLTYMLDKKQSIMQQVVAIMTVLLQLHKQQQQTRSELRRCGASICMKQEAVSGEFKQCSKCKTVVYCSRDCQLFDWSKGGHSKTCQNKINTVGAVC